MMVTEASRGGVEIGGTQLSEIDYYFAKRGLRRPCNRERSWWTRIHSAGCLEKPITNFVGPINDEEDSLNSRKKN